MLPRSQAEYDVQAAKTDTGRQRDSLRATTFAMIRSAALRAEELIVTPEWAMYQQMLAKRAEEAEQAAQAILDTFGSLYDPASVAKAQTMYRECKARANALREAIELPRLIASEYSRLKQSENGDGRNSQAAAG